MGTDSEKAEDAIVTAEMIKFATMELDVITEGTVIEVKKKRGKKRGRSAQSKNHKEERTDLSKGLD